MSLSQIVESIENDQFKLVVSLLLTIPLGFLNLYIKGETSRLLFGLIPGLLLQMYMFGLGSLNIHVAFWMCFFIIKYFPRQKVGWAVTIYVFAHITALNVWRMIYDYAGWTIDSSVLFMTTLPRFCAFAFCYSDGENISKLSAHKKKFAFETFSLLEYSSYVFCYSSCIIGPFFEFSEYLDFVNKRKDYGNIPSTVKPALKRFLAALLYIFIHLSLSKYGTTSFFYDNLGGKYIPDVAAYFLLYVIKYKYYIGFLLSETSCIASGLSFQKLEKGDNHERMRHVKLSKSEVFTSVKTFFHCWNMSIHLWLKRYIFFRLYNDDEYSDKKKSAKAKILTFAFSAFWHGFYPSYYIIFSHFAMALFVEENLDYIKSNIIKNPILHKIIQLIWHPSCYIVGLYLCGIMQELDIVYTYKFMKTLYFGPSILIVSWIIVSSLVIKLFKKKRTQKTD